MRSVRDITERIASLGPLPWRESSSGDSGAEGEQAGDDAVVDDEPVPDRYKCRNCGREADADVDVCPNCSSPNLRPLYF